MTGIAIVFVVLALIAAGVAAGLSEDEAFEWSAAIYGVSAILFLFAAVFFFLGRRAHAPLPPRMPPYR